MTLSRFRYFVLIAAACCFAWTMRAQPAPQQAASIEIGGDVKTPLSLTAADLSSMPQTTASIAGTNYSGVLLDDLLRRAGAPAGPTLRGKALTTCVVAEGADGYQVVFSLGELDPSITDNPVLVADASDGKPLSGAQGAFRLVIPKDKIGARSVRMLTKLTVMQLTK